MSRFDTAAADWDKGDIRQQIARNVSQAIIDNIVLKSNMDLLDFGAGTGLLTYSILPHVRSITAVDTSSKMLEMLKSKSTTEHQVKTECCDIMQMPMEEKFDGIISSMAMHHVEETPAFLKTLYDHLNPGGFIAIADLDKEDGGFHTNGNDGVFHFGFNRDVLEKMAISEGFEDVGFDTALTIEKPDASYPVFLFIAKKKD